MYDDNMQESSKVNELIISNILKALDIRCVRDSMYPNEIDSLVDIVRTHIMFNISDDRGQLREFNNVDELMISNMLLALKIRCVRLSFNPLEIELLVNFVRTHILINADYLLEHENNKSNKNIKTKRK